MTGAIFAHDKRPYLLAIAILTLLLVYTNYPSNSSVAAPVRRTLPVVPYPGSSPSPCPIPICECDCDCGNGKKVQLTGVTKSQTIHALPTVTLPSASSSSSPDSSSLSLSLPSPSDALTHSSSLWPRLTKQIYTSRPSVVKVATTQEDDDGTDYMQFVRATYPPVGPEKGSIMDPSYLVTPIAFGTPEAPIKDGDEIKYKDFSIGDNAFVPRPQCQKESDILQNYIYANQHPADCKTAKLFVRRHMPPWGLFAGLGLSSNYLYLATVLGRTLIDLSPNTYLTGACQKNGLECAFLPVGSCTANDFREDEVCYGPPCWDTARVISIDRFRTTDYLPCSPTEYPKERCNLSGGPKIHHSLHELLPGLRYHGEQFFQGEFTRYLTRPNAYLAEFTAGIMKNLTLTDELISVHVRHGDKTEGILFPNRAYGLVVRRAIQVTGIKTVFLGSDDNTVYEEVPKWVDLPGITYKWIDPSLNPMVHSASQAGTKGKNKIGMYLLAQNIIFAQSHTYIGTRSSNIGQVAFSLQNNDCSRPRIDYDMYGDLYYNSWYCRNDIEHAGREWMCALEKPGPGDTMWKWGGAKTQC